MKKITFILFTLIAGTAFAQNTADATAPVKAKIVAPIGITLQEGTLLDFGTFTKPGSNTGYVTMDPTVATNGRSFSGATDMLIADNTGNPSVPQFNITGDLTDSSTYNIVLAVKTSPAAGLKSLTLSDLTHSLSANENNTASSFKVGGKLEVPADADAGEYVGEISVTVKYD